ncbi:MAG: DNA polymerase I [Myxococcales bacterium FL481]|nr:MAG: DNA polymerase I [Myxococcales bacterium FL481]
MSEQPAGGPGSFFVVDANNFVFRAYHGLPMLNAPDGTPVNAVHGYVQMLQALRKQFTPQYLVAVFDAPGPGFRHKLHPEYKQNRPPPPDDLVPQFPLVRQATDALAVPKLEVPEVEADDVIASLAIVGQAAGLEVVVVSSDKDLMQLVDAPEDRRRPIRLWDTMKQRLIGPDQVRDKFGVGPDRLLDLLSLTGDSVDNVPGVPGIGPKTAAALLEEFGTLDGVLDHAAAIKQKKRRERLLEHADAARLSRQLIDLRRDLDVGRDLERYADPGPDVPTMEAFFGPLGFRSTLAGAVSSAAAGRRTPGAAGRGVALPRMETPPDIDPAATRVWGRAERAELAAYIEALRHSGGASLWVVLSHTEPMRAEIVGVGLGRESLDPSAVYLPVGHRSLTDLPQSQLAWDDVAEALTRLLSDDTVAIDCHDCKRVAVALGRHGVPGLRARIDPMLASYALDPARTSHTIEALATDVLDHRCIAVESVVGKGRKQVPFDQASVDVAAPYVGERVLVTGPLCRTLDAGVTAGGETMQRLFHAVEMKLAVVLGQMEVAGVALDPGVLAKQSEELGTKLAELEARICQEAGYELNPESPQQLQRLLFEERGLPAKKKTKTGYSTDASVLEELALLDPIVGPILDHRSLSKLKGTYLDALPAAIHPVTGRLHCQFRQAVAQTGRLSSSDPNLQNIPIRSELGRRVRNAFVAPAGQVLVAFDYSQIELRVLAHLSGDRSLCAAFRDGADVHRRTAAEVFDVDEAAVTDEQRRVAKAVNFGVIYGQGAFGLARALGIPQGKAGRYIKSYFAKIPGVDAYMQSLIDKARRSGVAETILGRKRRIPELAARGAARSYGERIARNTPIQGSAADILKLAMIAVGEALADVSWAKMVLTVHDELIFECDADRVADLDRLVRPAMEGAFALDVPLAVDVGSGSSWGAAKA